MRADAERKMGCPEQSCSFVFSCSDKAWMTSPSASACSCSLLNTFCQTQDEECQSSTIIYTPCIFHTEVSQQAAAYFIPPRGRNISHREQAEIRGMNKQEPLQVLSFTISERKIAVRGEKMTVSEVFAPRTPGVAERRCLMVRGALTGVEGWCIFGNYYVCALWVPNLSRRTQLPAQGVCHLQKLLQLVKEETGCALQGLHCRISSWAERGSVQLCSECGKGKQPGS